MLKKWNYDEIHCGYPIAGIEIDIVIILKGEIYGIDLIGYPGVFEAKLPTEHWGILERMNIKLFALPYSAWHLNREQCLKSLRKFISTKS